MAHKTRRYFVSLDSRTAQEAGWLGNGNKGAGIRRVFAVWRNNPHLLEAITEHDLWVEDGLSPAEIDELKRLADPRDGGARSMQRGSIRLGCDVWRAAAILGGEGGVSEGIRTSLHLAIRNIMLAVQCLERHQEPDKTSRSTDSTPNPFV